jgi:hypothetical protein
MVVPYLKKNGKYSLYNTALDNKPREEDFWFDESNKFNVIGLSSEEFDFIGPFVEGFAIAKKDGKDVFVSTNGKILSTKFDYQEIRNFENGIAPVCRSYKVDYPQWRFINKNGIEIVDDCFEEFQILDNGFIEVTKYTSYYGGGYYGESLSVSQFVNGIINVTGNLIIKPTSYSTYIYHKKFIVSYYTSSNSGREFTYYYDLNGEVLDKGPFLKFNYLGQTYENRGIARLKETNEIVIIDDSLNIIKYLGVYDLGSLGESYTIFPKIYSQYFFGGVCAIKNNGKWGLINSQGEMVLKSKYDFIGGFTDYKMWDNLTIGCAVVGKLIDSNMKFTAINSDFEELTSFQFDEINLFNEGVACVRIGEKWGAINSFGQTIVPIEFNYIRDCESGFIIVGLGDFESYDFIGHYGLYDIQGNKLTKLIYEFIGNYNSGFAIYKKQGKYGLFDDCGKEIGSWYKLQYDDISYQYEKFYLVDTDKNSFYIDSSGREFREV